ncbi:leucyl aminopeptidase [Paenibacillus yonginensis]|uniref:leucyl aminopeptidase n=1 Tax=Paenibacillus yonginensis TaxID=1462996 RepID=UPI000AAE7CB9|nr:leucyl aminopeptidase [Paenibacillus yonginensis]
MNKYSQDDKKDGAEMDGNVAEVLWNSGGIPKEAERKVLILLVTKKGVKSGEVEPWLKPFAGTLLQNRLFEGEVNQTFVLPMPKPNPAETVILVGAGEDPLTAEELRLSAASAARTALTMRPEQVLFKVPVSLGSLTVEGRNEIAAQALTEGFLLGAYQRQNYKREKSAYEGIRKVFFFHEEAEVGSEQEEWQQGIRLGRAFAAGTITARDLTNLPANLLTPEDLGDAAVELAQRYGLDVEVLDEADLQEKEMGGLLAVGQGSVHPPRMIIIKYKGGEEWNDVTGLVGKGITFDTGGISLKRAPGMEEMISDMGGAASVLGVMEILGILRPKTNVIAVIPAAENMPSGSAMKPGDILTTRSGRTIEMQNADAEGRIVLADGVTYAKEQGAERIIDIATLTGAILFALGDVATGAVTNDDILLQSFIMASKQTGEKVWPLPNYPEYWNMLKSSVADLNNRPGRNAAAITAGLFIGTFAEGLPWIHLDIAGTAYLNKERGVDPKGATGVMVRTMAQWILQNGQK